MSYTRGQRVRIVNPRSCWDSRIGTVVSDDGELVDVDIPGRDFTYAFKHTDIEPVIGRQKRSDEQCRWCGTTYKGAVALREHWESEHREEAMQSEKLSPAVPKNPEPEVIHPTRATIIREVGKPAYVEFEADGHLVVAGYLYPTAQEAQDEAAAEEVGEVEGPLKVGDRVRSTSPFFHTGATGVVTRIPEDQDRRTEVRLDTARPGDGPTTFYARSLVRIDDGPT